MRQWGNGEPGHRSGRLGPRAPKKSKAQLEAELSTAKAALAKYEAQGYPQMSKALDEAKAVLAEKDKALALAQNMVMEQFGWTPDEYGQKSVELSEDSRLVDAHYEALKIFYLNRNLLNEDLRGNTLERLVNEAADALAASRAGRKT